MQKTLLKNLTSQLPNKIDKIIKLIDKNALGIVFIVNKNKKLIGSISDGDIRRYYIRNGKLPDKVTLESKIINKNPFHLPITASIQTLLKYLQPRAVRSKITVKCIPLVNKKKIILDIATKDRPKNYPIAEPNIGQKEITNVLEAINSGWISSRGPYLDKFENKFSRFLNGGFCVSTSSGTTALQLGMSTLGISKNDEVIVPSFTFAASINAIINCGAKPVIADVEISTWTICLKSIKKLITNKTKAIMIVHVYGQPSKIDEIKKLCRLKNILLIEDCAEAIGAKYKNRLVGLDGDCSCFSFFANKTITTGEGGMVVFKDKKLAEKAKILRNHGMSTKKNYWHDAVGFNYRMTNIQAAIGLAQIDRINYLLSERKKIFDNYNRLLKNIKCLKFLPSNSWSQNSYWLYTIILKKQIREKILNKLQNQGIDVRRTFYPLNIMPPYKKFSKYECKVSEFLGLNGISLPSSNINFKEQKYIANILKKELKIL